MHQKVQSDQGLHCWPFRLHLLEALLMVKPHCSDFRSITAQFSGVPSFRIFTVLSWNVSECSRLKKQREADEMAEQERERIELERRKLAEIEREKKMKEDYARKLEEMKKKQAEEEKKRKGFVTYFFFIWIGFDLLAKHKMIKHRIQTTKK